MNIKLTSTKGICVFVILTVWISSSLSQGRKAESIPENVIAKYDLVYCKLGDRELKLDLFRPRQNDQLHPGVVFVHGGGWRSGDKTHFQRQAVYLASKGYVCICIEYRLSGEALFPAALEDAKCAVRWMRAHAERLHVDPDRIASAGGSAGGHLAAMLAVTGKKDGFEGKGGYDEFSSRSNLAVIFNGALNLAQLAEKKPDASMLVQFLGGTYDEKEGTYRKASPITYVDSSCPPFLLLHGTEDTTVPFSQAVEFKHALEKAGVKAELVPAEGENHAYFNSSPHFEITLKEMEKFLANHFKKAQ